MAINEKVIPQELKDLNQWVCWKEVERKGAISKVPINPRTRGFAQTNNPRTWGSFAEAVNACRKFKLKGVGFVFTGNDPYVGIDLDHCLDDRGSIVSMDTVAILNRYPSYTETSPSGRGLHIICKMVVPFTGKKVADRMEVYATGRYFTVTGDTWDFREEIRELTWSE